jgi:hypothetical protein
VNEIVVFVSYENDASPRALAGELLTELALSALAVGVDALTGGCEVRLHFHPETLQAVRQYLERRKIVHDIAFL